MARSPDSDVGKMEPITAKTGARRAGGGFVQLLRAAIRGSRHELFLVGGAVRDTLLGREVAELDFATDALPEEIVRAIEQLPDFSVYRVGEKFGTIGAVHDGWRAEITTYRSGERYVTGSRKPMVEFGARLEDDLGRRDFTVNAMALTADVISAWEPGGLVSLVVPEPDLIDPFGGRQDLSARVIRSVGEPLDRFREDPLRLLRGVRFVAELGFGFDSRTWEAVRAAASWLALISRERVADELNRMLVGRDPARAMTLLRDAGLLQAVVPQLTILDAMVDHGPRHSLSLWDHTMRVLASTPADLTSRWAALLHDIGKPATRTFDPEGRIRFYHHEDLGAEMAADILQSLRTSNEMLMSIRDLIETHMQFHQYTEEWSDGAVRRLCRRLGPNFGRAMDLARADAEGHGNTSWGSTDVDALGKRAHGLEESVPEIGSPLNGHELMEHYGREAGPWIGRIKHLLAEQVLEGTLATGDKEGAWFHADRFMKEMRG